MVGFYQGPCTIEIKSHGYRQIQFINISQIRYIIIYKCIVKLLPNKIVISLFGRILNNISDILYIINIMFVNIKIS